MGPMCFLHSCCRCFPHTMWSKATHILARVLFHITFVLLFISDVSQCSATHKQHTIQQTLSKSSQSGPLDLQCPPCERLHCTPRRASRLKCRGGVTTGICGCCPVCAQLAGERCGGAWDYLGKCDRGLRCATGELNIFNGVWSDDRMIADESVAMKSRSYAPNTNRRDNAALTPEGICIPVRTEFAADSPLNSFCRPPCTRSFCLKNPRAICSSAENYFRKQPCQGDCQHTSCAACRDVPDVSKCGKCAQDDFSCIHSYARCIKRDHCTRRKYPCKQNRGQPEAGSRFECVIPECVTTT